MNRKSWPTVAEVLAYQKQVRERILDVLHEVVELALRVSLANDSSDPIATNCRILEVNIVTQIYEITIGCTRT